MNFSNNSPSAVAVLAGQEAQINDGASCYLAESPIPDFAAVDDSGVVKANGVLNVPASQGLLVNDSGQGIYVSSHTQPSHGTVVVNSDGSYTYTPNPGYVGMDSFSYTITDEFGQTTTATVTIQVNNGSEIAASDESEELAKTGIKQHIYIITASSLVMVGLLINRRFYSV